jgi:hypothetical protein
VSARRRTAEPSRVYCCRECEVGVGPITRAQALEQLADGHTLFVPANQFQPMPAADAESDAEQLRVLNFRFDDLGDAAVALRRGQEQMAIAAAVREARYVFERIPELREARS